MTGSNTALLVGLVGAAAAIAGAAVQGYFGLRQRRLDIFLTNKAQAYGSLFWHVLKLNADPHDADRYACYRASFEVAKMFASEQVRRILEGKHGPSEDSIDYAVQRLRRAPADEKDSVRANFFHESLKQLSDACRHDLQRLN
jgi:hypothetical protein